MSLAAQRDVTAVRNTHPKATSPTSKPSWFERSSKVQLVLKQSNSKSQALCSDLTTFMLYTRCCDITMLRCVHSALVDAVCASTIRLSPRKTACQPLQRCERPTSCLVYYITSLHSSAMHRLHACRRSLYGHTTSNSTKTIGSRTMLPTWLWKECRCL